MARQEREEFADLLGGLKPEQWEAPTRCERWRVRDVVAHVISYDELSSAQLRQRVLKGMFSGRPTNAVGVADYAERSPEQLIELMPSPPLALPRAITPERLTAASSASGMGTEP